MSVVALSLALAVALAAAGEGEGAGAPAETTVVERAPVDIDDDRALLDDLDLAAPEDALLRALGAGVIHDGGPLAPSRVMIRGLGGSRVRAEAFGLRLDDPATGLWDAALLPWAAADSAVVESGAGGDGVAGRVRLAPARAPGLRARFLFGSLETVRGAVSAADERTFVAADAGVTRGNFAFVPTSPIASAGEGPLERKNNDHRRASAVAAVRARAEEIDVDGVLLAAGHTGGIAGMATSPTTELRAEDGVVGARVAGRRRVPASTARASVSVDARAVHRATSDPAGRRDALESTSARVTVAVDAVDIGLGTIGVLSGADTGALADRRFARTGVDARLTWSAPPIAFVRTRFALDGRTSNSGARLWGGEARAEVGDTDDGLRASLGVARASREPTLDELYAPRGLVGGNADLAPEAATDVELAIAATPGGAAFEARAVAFAGVVEDAIAYVNRNAYEIAPLNLGRAWRAGCDISVTVEPSDLVRLFVVAEVLASIVDETGAPLPLAPPFMSLTSVRLGPAGGPTLTTSLRSRGAASSNAFGTLIAPAYSTVDIAARAPIGTNLAVGASLHNALDVRDARDANQLPLPGRLLFFTLEVRG